MDGSEPQVKKSRKNEVQIGGNGGRGGGDLINEKVMKTSPNQRPRKNEVQIGGTDGEKGFNQ